MKTRLLVTMALLCLTAPCSESDEARPSAQSVARSSQSATASSAASQSSVAPPSSSFAQASAAQFARPKVDALEVCKLIESAKVGSDCQRKPPTQAGEQVAQFEMKGTPKRPEPLYGAVFAYESTKQFEERFEEASSASAKQGTSGNRRLPGVVVGNEKVLAFAYADGELPIEHAVEIRRIILALKP